MTGELAHVVMVDGPSLFAPLEEWEAHLQFLYSLPENTALRPEMIARAEEVIAKMRREAGLLS